MRIKKYLHTQGSGDFFAGARVVGDLKYLREEGAYGWGLKRVL